MFKLVKILNSKSGAPEIITMPFSEHSSIEAGNLCFLGCGMVSNGRFEYDDMLFIPVETLPVKSGKNFVRGYIVTSDMIFETEIHGDHDSFSVGDSISHHIHTTGVVDSVDATEGNEAKIISKEDVDKTGKVRIVLKW